MILFFIVFFRRHYMTALDIYGMILFAAIIIGFLYLSNTVKCRVYDKETATQRKKKVKIPKQHQVFRRSSLINSALIVQYIELYVTQCL